METVEYCQRHRFKWDGYPDAANNTTWFGAVPVNFDLLPTRLEALASQLNKVYKHLFRNVFFESLNTHGVNTAGEYATMSLTSAG